VISRISLDINQDRSDHTLTKIFRIKIKIRLKLKILLLWIVFETYHNYLTIDCLHLIKHILQTRLLGILSFFMKEKVNLTVMEI